MKTLFPNRVWQPTGNGWVTREPTAEDYARRKAYRERLQHETSPSEARKQKPDGDLSGTGCNQVKKRIPRYEYFDGSGE